MFTLFNRNHNGDIFYSRPIIQKLLDNNFKVSYYHNCNHKILEDLPVSYAGPPSKLLVENIPDKVIETWIGKRNLKFLSQGCSFVGHSSLAKDIFDEYRIVYKNDLEFLPTVAYHNLDQEVISKINDSMGTIKDKFKKVVLICNNKCLSGQAQNFDFNPVISRLCESHKEVFFIVSNPTNLRAANLLEVSNIVGNMDCDLLYLSYLSTHSNIIVGRASGPHCFTHVRENLLNEKKTYISITNSYNEGAWFTQSTARQIWNNNYSLSSVFNLINNEI